jgi:hypothetical protein
MKSLSTHVVDHLSGDPDLGVDSRHDDGRQLGPSDKSGVKLLDRFRSSVRPEVSLREDVQPSVDLGSGQGVLQDLRPIDGLGRDPDAGGRNEDGRGQQLGLRDLLHVCLGLHLGMQHSDRCGDDLGLRRVQSRAYRAFAGR